MLGAVALKANFQGSELRVLLHAVMHIRGHLALAKQALTCVEAILIPLGPIRIDCEFIEKTVLVNPRHDEQTAFGHRDREAAPRVLVTVGEFCFSPGTAGWPRVVPRRG